MGRPSRILLAAILGVAPLSSALGQDAVAFDKEAVIARACYILLANQEAYEPDRPIGTLPDDELVPWQRRERERLDRLREASRGEASEWPYEGVYRVKGRIPAGYRVGGTAIVCEALLEAPGLDDARREAIIRGVEFMLDRIASDPGMRPRAQTSYNVRNWGHAYALKLILRALEVKLLDEALAKRVVTTIPHLIKCLKVGQVEGGGWNYAGGSCSPFMTGAVLIVLFEAVEQGYAVDADMITAALDALEKGRGENAAYAYSGAVSRRRTERMEGASARSAIAELCLFRAGRSDADRLRAAIDGFFAEESWKALKQRKSQQKTHEPPFGIAPYYFFFGHTSAALAVEHLPKEERAPYRLRMRELLSRTLEEHGGWNDRVFPRTESYSTAMSVLALLAPELPRVAAWSKGDNR